MISDVNLLGMQKAMLDATPDCIKLLSKDGNLLAMNKAGCLALNVPQDSKFGMAWLSLLPEDVHQGGEAALCKAAMGQNARFPGRSESADGIRYWDNLLTPNIDPSGAVVSILCVSRDVTETTKLEKQLEAAMHRERLVSREMQHRVKNIFSVVSGLALIAQKEAHRANDPGAATGILCEKLVALSRASDVAFPNLNNTGLGPDQVDITILLESVLQPYGSRCRLVGDPVRICRDTVTNLALFLHELATNSVKYGALGADSGRVTIHWSAETARLRLTWRESGGPLVSSAPKRPGFGSGMIDRIVKSAGGTIDRLWQAEGLIVHLQLPI